MEGFDRETMVLEVQADTSALRREFDLAGKLGQQFSRSLVSAFEGVALKGRSLGDVLRSVTLSLSRVALRSAFKPLEQGISSAFTSLFSSVAGGGGTAFAKGAAFAGGMPVPFAKGGVVASPVTFPLGRGLGLAGEAGPEAILPLARGADGRLGVRAGAGGGMAPQVTFNVTTPDAASFQRSQTQIAAMLARTVGRGERNL
ncbi:MAG: phage tail tape measure protein [Pseudomonadota bacterium]